MVEMKIPGILDVVRVSVLAEDKVSAESKALGVVSNGISKSCCDIDRTITLDEHNYRQVQPIYITDFHTLINWCCDKLDDNYNKMHDRLVDIDMHTGPVYIEDMRVELNEYLDDLKKRLTPEQIEVMMCVVEFAEHHRVDDFYIEPKNW